MVLWDSWELVSRCSFLLLNLWRSGVWFHTLILCLELVFDYKTMLFCIKTLRSCVTTIYGDRSNTGGFVQISVLNRTDLCLYRKIGLYHVFWHGDHMRISVMRSLTGSWLHAVTCGDSIVVGFWLVLHLGIWGVPYYADFIVRVVLWYHMF